MKTNWTVSRNWEKGIKFHNKGGGLSVYRIVTIMTKRQKDVLLSYCKSQGLEVSTFVRGLLGEYFERVGYDLPDDEKDENQLRIFPE